MKRMIPIVFLAALAALVIAVATSGSAKTHRTAETGTQAGVHGGGMYGGGRSVATPPAAGSVIGVRSTKLGKILVDANGRTLYLFEADKPDVSNCTGPCLSIWPALTTNGTPHAAAGALAGKIGTITTGGKQQVTYNHHPLYYYAADQKPGDTTGEGLDQFGAKWYVLAASGDKVDDD